MRWVVKTSLDGKIYDDIACEGPPPIPDDGANLLLPIDGHYVPGVVAETSVDESHCPAVLRIVCLNPHAYAKS